MSSVQASPSLSHITAMVNGERRVVMAGDQLDLVAGDRLVLAAVEATDGTKRLRSTLNFVGFPGRDPSRVWDDRGVEINTATDLIPAHALKGQDNIYIVRSEINGKLIGQIRVRIFVPKLKFAEILINGQTRALRDGELLTVLGSDQVKVIRFESNISNAEQLNFKFQRSSSTVKTESGPVKAGYEFVFAREGRQFARIPVRVLSEAVGLGEPNESDSALK